MCRSLPHMPEALIEEAGVGRKINLTVNRNGQSRKIEAAVVDIGQTATPG